jgi:hypothetical protein
VLNFNEKKGGSRSPLGKIKTGREPAENGELAPAISFSFRSGCFDDSAD